MRYFIRQCIDLFRTFGVPNIGNNLISVGFLQLADDLLYILLNLPQIYHGLIYLLCVEDNISIGEQRLYKIECIFQNFAEILNSGPYSNRCLTIFLDFCLQKLERIIKLGVFSRDALINKC